jgi:resuscitation-promoting factor RpfB
LDYKIGYLQALFPEQSETSRYRLTVMDRDGSNRRSLFPPQDKPGMEPKQNWGDWSPAPLPEGSAESDGSNYAMTVIYEGNLWIVNVHSGTAIQITGDGLTSRVLWR